MWYCLKVNLIQLFNQLQIFLNSSYRYNISLWSCDNDRFLHKKNEFKNKKTN